LQPHRPSELYYILPCLLTYTYITNFKYQPLNSIPVQCDPLTSRLDGALVCFHAIHFAQNYNAIQYSITLQYSATQHTVQRYTTYGTALHNIWHSAAQHTVQRCTTYVQRCTTYSTALHNIRYSVAQHTVQRCTTYGTALHNIRYSVTQHTVQRYTTYGTALHNIRYSAAQHTVQCYTTCIAVLMFQQFKNKINTKHAILFFFQYTSLDAQLIFLNLTQQTSPAHFCAHPERVRRPVSLLLHVYCCQWLPSSCHSIYIS